MNELYETIDIYRGLLKMDAGDTFYPWHGRMIQDLTDKVADLQDLYLKDKPIGKDIDEEKLIPALEGVQIAISEYSSKVDKYVLDESNERDFEDSEFSLQDFGEAWNRLESTISAVVEDPFVFAMETREELDEMEQVTRPNALPQRAFNYMFNGLKNIKDPQYMEVYLNSCLMMLGGAKTAENMFRPQWGVIDPGDLEGPIRHLLDGSDATGYYNEYGDMGAVPGLPETVARLVRVMDSSPTYQRDPVPGLEATLRDQDGYLPGLIAIKTFRHVVTGMVKAFPDIGERLFLWDKVLQNMWPAMKLMGFDKAPFLISGQEFLTKELRLAVVPEKKRSPSVFEDMDVAPAGARFGMDKGKENAEEPPTGEEAKDNGGEGPSNRSTCRKVAETIAGTLLTVFLSQRGSFLLTFLCWDVTEYLVSEPVVYVGGNRSVPLTQGVNFGLTLSPALWQAMVFLLMNLGYIRLMMLDNKYAQKDSQRPGPTGFGNAGGRITAKQTSEESRQGLLSKFVSVFGVFARGGQQLGDLTNRFFPGQVENALDIARSMNFPVDDMLNLTPDQFASNVGRWTGAVLRFTAPSAITLWFISAGESVALSSLPAAAQAIVSVARGRSPTSAGLSFLTSVGTSTLAANYVAAQSELFWAIASLGVPFLFFGNAAYSQFQTVNYKNRGPYRHYINYLTFVSGLAFIMPYLSRWFVQVGDTGVVGGQYVADYPISTFASTAFSIAWVIWRVQTNMTVSSGDLGRDFSVDDPPPAPRTGTGTVEEIPAMTETEVLFGDTQTRFADGTHVQLGNDVLDAEILSIRDALLGLSRRRVELVTSIIDSLYEGPRSSGLTKDQREQAKVTVEQLKKNFRENARNPSGKRRILRQEERNAYVLSQRIHVTMIRLVMEVSVRSLFRIQLLPETTAIQEGPIDENFAAWESEVVTLNDKFKKYVESSLREAGKRLEEIQAFTELTPTPGNMLRMVQTGQTSANALIAFLVRVEQDPNEVIEFSELITVYLEYQSYLFGRALVKRTT